MNKNQEHLGILRGKTHVHFQGVLFLSYKSNFD